MFSVVGETIPDHILIIKDNAVKEIRVDLGLILTFFIVFSYKILLIYPFSK